MFVGDGQEHYMPDSPASLMVNIFDGTRQPLTTDEKLLIRVIDGNQKEQSAGFHNGPSVLFQNLPVFDNFGDNYTVIVSAAGYLDAGFTPVHILKGTVTALDLMLLPRDSAFNFAGLTWAALPQKFPKLFELLSNDLPAQQAEDRFDAMRETADRQPILACLINITTAMSVINLPVGKALDYVQRLIWDDTMKQDRFYAWADKKLLDQTIQAAVQREFAREVGFQFFHKNATDSYKQVQFGEANVQLTFHGDDLPPTDLPGSIKLEPDIDYFKDIGAHALLEVIPNALEKLGGQTGLTDPKQVYVLRWIAGRHAGVPEFDPLYTIVPA
jgi:hypothetical protein